MWDRSRPEPRYYHVSAAWSTLQCGPCAIVASSALGPAFETVADVLHVLSIVIHPDIILIIIIIIISCHLAYRVFISIWHCLLPSHSEFWPGVSPYTSWSWSPLWSAGVSFIKVKMFLFFKFTNCLSTSFTSTKVKLRLRFTWRSPDIHLTTWPSSDLPLTLTRPLPNLDY